MGIIERTYGKETNTVVDELLISSDSHVIEPAGLWQKRLPKAFQNRAPDFGGQRPNDTPGGAQDKNKRVSEMAADGVSAEVLYPTHGLKCLSLDDHELEKASCQVYNDWLIDYCGAAPDRLIGIAMLSMYDGDGAVEELERCRKAGMRYRHSAMGRSNQQRRQKAYRARQAMQRDRAQGSNQDRANASTSTKGMPSLVEVMSRTSISGSTSATSRT